MKDLIQQIEDRVNQIETLTDEIITLANIYIEQQTLFNQYINKHLNKTTNIY